MQSGSFAAEDLIDEPSRVAKHRSKIQREFIFLLLGFFILESLLG